MYITSSTGSSRRSVASLVRALLVGSTTIAATSSGGWSWFTQASPMERCRAPRCTHPRAALPPRILLNASNLVPPTHVPLHSTRVTYPTLGPRSRVPSHHKASTPTTWDPTPPARTATHSHSCPLDHPPTWHRRAGYGLLPGCARSLSMMTHALSLDPRRLATRQCHRATQAAALGLYVLYGRQEGDAASGTERAGGRGRCPRSRRQGLEDAVASGAGVLGRRSSE